MTGADMLVQVLADEGVDTVFGYSGGAILPIYDAVFRFNEEHDSAMPLVVPANEQGAAFMAAGFARASGRVGVGTRRHSREPRSRLWQPEQGGGQHCYAPLWLPGRSGRERHVFEVRSETPSR